VAFGEAQRVLQQVHLRSRTLGRARGARRAVRHVLGRPGARRLRGVTRGRGGWLRLSSTGGKGLELFQATTEAVHLVHVANDAASPSGMHFLHRSPRLKYLVHGASFRTRTAEKNATLHSTRGCTTQRTCAARPFGIDTTH
jgi:hypothetical protein